MEMETEQISSSLRTHFLELLELLLPGISADTVLYNVIAISATLAFAAVVYLFARIVIRPQIATWVKRSDAQWDNGLLKHGFFRRLLHLLPALCITLIIPSLIEHTSLLSGFMVKLAMLYMLFSGMLAVFALLSTLEDVYNSSGTTRRAPITGFIQVTKLVFAIIVVLLSISLVIDRSPLILVSGLTAIAAVLLLIFRDTILGFVAGIQIAANRMFNTGDWIQMPKYEVDGVIIEIGLTNVKVQNWDMTISTLPTYSLTNEAVKNWRGMEESGGRRIKRAIYINIHSVKLCTPEMLEKFSNIRYISKYIEDKVSELQTFHKDNAIEERDLLNNRKLTNIGTFRAYLTAYISKHPKVNQSMTHMVRQLPPTELGLPLEVYCFSTEQQWVQYEQVQADIFDHIMAMLDQFELSAYQRDGHLSSMLSQSSSAQTSGQEERPDKESSE
ncbi:mechanosensitive ion channel family protein [Alteromonas halophila]|uniref:Membrane protein n=1 Tax=Alteromonas halophila TaxID=516698 RepID=A0A918JN78_9ALTE|nr:mechanosensitive ion channel family protein [Alteromonas halophila]GGW91841.1 membrane protein [Alteromonas halophila]